MQATDEFYEQRYDTWKRQEKYCARCEGPIESVRDARLIFNEFKAPVWSPAAVVCTECYDIPDARLRKDLTEASAFIHFERQEEMELEERSQARRAPKTKIPEIESFIADLRTKYGTSFIRRLKEAL